MNELQISECLQLSDISSIKVPVFMLGNLCHPVSVATSSPIFFRHPDIQPCTPELPEEKQIVMLKLTN